jgi:hypothetical protein
MSGLSKSRIQRIVVNNAIQAQQATIASTSTSAISASYALTASYAMNGGGGGGGTTTGSFTGSFTGSLLGTASYALTASFAMNGGGSINTSSFVTTSSFNTFTSSIQGQVTSLTNATSSYVRNNQTGSFTTTSSFNTFTGSYNTGSFTGSFTGNLIGTSSWATNALTASFVTGTITSASYAISSSYSERTDKINVIINSSSAVFYPVFVDDAGNRVPYLDGDLSYVPSTNQLNVGGITSSLFGTSSWATSASQALTASFLPIGTYNITSSWAISASQAISSSRAISSSFASTASFINPLNQNVQITGSLIVSGSGATIELYGDKLILGAVGGSEGGEILLSKPLISSSLTGSGITVDSYQNQLRFFEQGGNARGAYLDITTLGNGVGTNLQKSNNYFYDAYLINAQTTAAGADTTINNISLVTKANEAWSFEFTTVGQCSGTGGVRFTVIYSAVPVSSSVSYWGNSTQVGNMTSATSVTTTPAQSNTMWATATPIDVQANIRTSFVNGANANTVTIKVQPQNGAQTATLRAMTYLTARRIS